METYLSKHCQEGIGKQLKLYFLGPKEWNLLAQVEGREMLVLNWNNWNDSDPGFYNANKNQNKSIFMTEVILFFRSQLPF